MRGIQPQVRQPSRIALRSTSSMSGSRGVRVRSGISRVFRPRLKVGPPIEPLASLRGAFVAQLIGEPAAAVEFRRIAELVRGLLRHLDRAYGDWLKTFRERMAWFFHPFVDLQQEIQLLVC